MSSNPNALERAAEVSDEDLLIQMALKDSEPQEAQAAWAQFHKRHHSYLRKHAYKVLDGFLGSRYDGSAKIEMASELATDVLMRAYLRAETFDLKGGRGPTEVRRQVRAWLGKIAQNIVCDWLTGRCHETADASIHELPEDEQPNNNPEHPEFLRCVAEALDQLPEKERRVILAYMSFFDPATGRGRLSNDASADLMAELGMTTFSLRQMRHRALKRLKEIIKAKCKAHAPVNFPW